MIIGGSTFQFAPLLQQHGYDPIKSFAAISQLAIAPNVLVVNSASPVNSVKELIALANSKPGQPYHGSSGPDGSLYLAAEMLRTMTGINIVLVPYKSSAPAISGLWGEEVQLVFSTASGALPHLKSGKLKALAVTSPQPTQLVPGVPTMASQGLPGFELENMYFILAPAGTPALVIRRLNKEIVMMLTEPEVKDPLLSGGFEAVSSTPEQLTAKMQFDNTKMRKVFEAIGLTIKK